ncbi:hypothetical protein ACS0TY_030102 [Phlomoides rotata]
MSFIFVLIGWEGSTTYSKILRDAVTHSNGLRGCNHMSKLRLTLAGCYYLCDSGYTNCNGFLAPYRGVRYHLKEWDGYMMMHINN